MHQVIQNSLEKFLKMNRSPFPLNEKASEWCRRNIGDIEVKSKKFTSIKQIPKEAIEMIDEVQWFCELWDGNQFDWCKAYINSETIIGIANSLKESGELEDDDYRYIEPFEFEDKTYGINLYKKIHGIKLDPVPLISEEKDEKDLSDASDTIEE